jgi:hypothetical protein
MLVIPVILAALLQDTVDNPEYQGWASFNPGSSVTTRSERSGVPAGDIQKTTLLSVGETEVVVQTEVLVNGAVEGKTVQQKIPAKIPVAKQRKVLDAGREEIRVGGRKMTCSWKHLESLSGGVVDTMKLWMSDEIPGKIARVEVYGRASGPQVRIATEWEKK